MFSFMLIPSSLSHLFFLFFFHSSFSLTNSHILGLQQLNINYNRQLELHKYNAGGPVSYMDNAMLRLMRRCAGERSGRGLPPYAAY